MTSTKKHLNHLETVGLIKLAQTHPELEFMFRHALVQEAAYNSLLIEDRKKLHRQVGEAIEEIYPDRLEEFAAMLGNHFEIAGDNQQALKYFILAGDTGFGIYANAEAVTHYTRALKLAGQSETSSKTLTHLYTRLGRALELTTQYDEALNKYKEMETLGHQSNDHAMKLAALMARSTLYVTFTPVHNPEQGEALSEQALTLAHDLGDQAAEARISWNLLNLYQYSGRLRQATDYGERSLALARQLNLREQMAFALNDLGMCYWANRRIDHAKESLREAGSLWQELDNLPMLTDNLSMSCTAWLFAGEYEQAIAFSKEAFQISQTTNNLWGQFYSRMCVSRAYWEYGQPTHALDSAKDSLRLSGLSGLTPPQLFAHTDQAAIYGSLGAIERGLEAAQHALAAAETEFSIYRTYVLGTLAQLHLSNNNLAEAEATIDKAQNDLSREGHPMYFQYVILADAELALRQGDYERTVTVTKELLADLRHFGIRMFIPSALYLQGQALQALGQTEAARRRLQEARTEAEAMGARWMLWQILFALSNHETDPTETKNLRQQAREIVQYIANHINQDDLRRSFLSLPDVRAVLD